MNTRVKVFYFFQEETEDDIESKVNDWARRENANILNASVASEGAPHFNIFIVVVYESQTPVAMP